MSIPSENHRAAASTPGGLLRVISRWVVEQTGLFTLLIVLLVAGLCLGQWRLAYREAQDWDASHPGQPVLFRLLAPTGWLLMISTGGWLGLWHLGGGGQHVLHHGPCRQLMAKQVICETHR